MGEENWIIDKMIYILVTHIIQGQRAIIRIKFWQNLLKMLLMIIVTIIFVGNFFLGVYYMLERFRNAKKYHFYNVCRAQLNRAGVFLGAIRPTLSLVTNWRLGTYYWAGYPWWSGWVINYPPSLVAVWVLRWLLPEWLSIAFNRGTGRQCLYYSVMNIL